MKRTLAAAMALLATFASAAEKTVPVRVYLEPIGDDVVHGFEVEKVQATLRQRLEHAKELQLVPTGDQAEIVLRVTECVAWSEKRRINEAGDRPVAGPTGKGGVAGGWEGAYGVRTESRPQVSLIVRATWSGRFEDLQSRDADRQLKDAADSVTSQLVRRVQRGLAAN